VRKPFERLVRAFKLNLNKKYYVGGSFIRSNSIVTITPLVGQILIELEMRREQGEITEVYLFYNRPEIGSIYTAVMQRLLPLEVLWRDELASITWLSRNLPVVMNDGIKTLQGFIHEYLFL
jgi:F-type H+-transporting ATPase subunit gamma